MDEQDHAQNIKYKCGHSPKLIKKFNLAQYSSKFKFDTKAHVQFDFVHLTYTFMSTILQNLISLSKYKATQ